MINKKIFQLNQATNHIGGLTETLVKQSLDNLQLQYTYNSSYQPKDKIPVDPPSVLDGGLETLTPTKDLPLYQTPGPDFKITGPEKFVTGGPVEIEVKQRKHGFTREDDLQRMSEKFSPESRKVLVLFTYYGKGQLDKIRKWFGMRGIVLVILPAVPYTKTSSEYVFIPRSERRWYLTTLRKSVPSIKNALIAL